MGVLRESGQALSCRAVAFQKWGGNFVNRELINTKDMIEKYITRLPTFPCEAVHTSAQMVSHVIDQILQLQPICWSKEKLYTLYSLLATHMERLIVLLANNLSPATEPIYTHLKMAFETLVSFIGKTFEKLDDSLVTPVVLTTYGGLHKSYILTTDFAYARYTCVKDSVVLPVKDAVGAYVVVPIYKKVSGVVKCTTSTAISAGAAIDKRLSLVGLMSALVERSKSVDQCMTKGRITNGIVLPAIEAGKSLDKKVTNGSVEDFLKNACDEFQAAKGERPSTGAARVAQGNVTSAGAPVYRSSR